MTLEEAEKLIEARFDGYPTLGAVGRSSNLEQTLSEALAFEGIDQALLKFILYEVRVILSLYAPLSQLGPNIAETTGLPLIEAERLATLIRSIVLDAVIPELEEYEELWNEELKKAETRDPLSPNSSLPSAGETVPKPLTRQELMKALERRSTAGNLESMKQKLEEATQERVVGYDALPTEKENDR